jgi:hypothetical protein
MPSENWQKKFPNEWILNSNYILKLLNIKINEISINN